MVWIFSFLFSVYLLALENGFTTDLTGNYFAEIQKT